MARQVINVGAAPNDQTGDSLRVGGAKINSNFEELYELTSNLLPIAFSGDYNDLVNTPTIPDGGGEGDVQGAESSVDGELVVFSGETGKILAGGGGVPGTAAFLDVGTGSGDVAAGNRGVPTGGTAGQVLAKVDSTDFNVEWVEQTGGGGGSGDGDVEGPESSTDNEVVLFDGTTGKLIKGGGVLGDAAFATIGTGSGDVAEGDHIHDDATDTVAGFMSASDKAKLDLVDETAEPNPEDVTEGEIDTGTEAENRSWSPLLISYAITERAPDVISAIMDDESVLYKNEIGELTSVPTVPATALSFENFAAGDTPILLTTSGLKSISSPKSPSISSDIVLIDWDTVDSSLNVYLELDTGQDDLEIRVQELDMAIPSGAHLNLRGSRLFVQIENVDGAEKSVTFGTDTGYVPVLVRPGLTNETLFSGAGSKLFLTGLIGLDGTFVWLDATIPGAPV